MDRQNLIFFLKQAMVLLINENVFLKDLYYFLNVNNILCLYIFCGYSPLKRYLFSIIKQNFVGFSKTSQFGNINFYDIIKFVSSSSISLSSEFEVFQAIKQWIRQNENSRKRLMCDLLRRVRLPLLSFKVIEIIKNDKLCNSCETCIEYIEKALALKRNPNKPYSKSFLNRFVVKNCTFYQFERNLIRLTSDDEIIRLDYNHHPVEMKTLEFFIDRFYNLIHLKNSKVLTYEEVYPDVTNDKLENFACCLFMEKLYLTGGFYERAVDSSDICHAYDPETSEWKKMKRLQLPRACHSCVVFGGKIVAVGGTWDIEGSVGSVEAYDCFDDEWTFMPDLTEARSCHGSVAIGNKLYVVGGQGTRSCEVLDYLSNKFTAIKSIPFRSDGDEFENLDWFRAEDKIVVIYNCRYFKKNKKENNVYIYTPKKNIWTSMSFDFFKENPGHILYK